MQETVGSKWALATSEDHLPLTACLLPPLARSPVFSISGFATHMPEHLLFNLAKPAVATIV